jgi:hypothetical protein
MGDYVSLSRAFRYRLLVLLFFTTLLYKVSFLSIVKVFNILFIFLLSSIEFYRAYLLSLLGRVVTIIFSSRVRLVLFIKIIIPELSRGITFSF